MTHTGLTHICRNPFVPPPHPPSIHPAHAIQTIPHTHVHTAWIEYRLAPSHVAPVSNPKYPLIGSRRRAIIMVRPALLLAAAALAAPACAFVPRAAGPAASRTYSPFVCGVLLRLIGRVSVGRSVGRRWVRMLARDGNAFMCRLSLPLRPILCIYMRPFHTTAPNSAPPPCAAPAAGREQPGAQRV